MENNEETGDGVVEITGSKKDIWPSNVESYFIILMEVEVKKGNRRTTTLSKGAWKYIKEELKKQFGKEYTNIQFKNKFNQLRGRWKDFTTLLKMEMGLEYNSSTGRLVGTDDQWKKLCEKYKFAKQFKKKGCLHYEELCVIFRGTTVFGANHHPSTKSPSISYDDEDNEGDNDFDEEESSDQLRRKANASSGEGDSKKRKARESAQMTFTNALTNFGEMQKNLEIVKKMGASQVAVSATNTTGEVVGENNMQEKSSLLTCVAILQGLTDIDGASFTKALKLLKEDATWREVFLVLSDERKKDWVLNLA